MSIKFSGNPVHLQSGVKLDREYVSSHPQESRSANRRVFQQDTFEVSQFSKNREALMDKMKHTVVQPAASFSDTRAEILRGLREEKGQYGYSDVVNACGLSYAKLYSEIEQRHKDEQEQYYKADGTPLTKEEETGWLDMQFGQEVAWQKSCARIAAQGQVFQGKIPEIPTKEIEELEDSLYQSKETYMKLYQDRGQTGKLPALQNYMFGNSQTYEILNRLGNLWERME